MTERRWQVLFTATASAQVDAIQEWWLVERTASPTLFTDELAVAVERPSRYPGTGSRFESDAVRGLRRIVLASSRYHAYYTVDSARSEILVRAVWHAARGRGPQFT